MGISDATPPLLQAPIRLQGGSIGDKQNRTVWPVPSRWSDHCLGMDHCWRASAESENINYIWWMSFDIRTSCRRSGRPGSWLPPPVNRIFCSMSAANSGSFSELMLLWMACGRAKEKVSSGNLKKMWHRTKSRTAAKDARFEVSLRGMVPIVGHIKRLFLACDDELKKNVTRTSHYCTW